MRDLFLVLVGVLISFDLCAVLWIWREDRRR